jgi:hypothetical protein
MASGCRTKNFVTAISTGHSQLFSKSVQPKHKKMSKRHSRSNNRGKPIERKKRSKLFWTFAITLALIILAAVILEKNRRDRLRIENAAKQTGNPQSDTVAANQITDLRKQYENEIRGANTLVEENPAKLSRFHKRLEICSKILKSATEPADIEFAKREQLQSHAAFYRINALESLGVTGLDSEFEDVIKTRKADKNKNIQQLAFVAGMEKTILDYLTASEPEKIAPLVEQEMSNLQSQFPDQFDVAVHTSDLLPFFKIQPDKAERIEFILDSILQTWGKSTNGTIQTWLEEILDAKKLVSLKFFSLDLLCRNPALPDSLAAGDLIMESSKLAIARQLSATGLDAILDLAEQFEINDWYDKAGELYSIVQEHLKTRTGLADAPMAKYDSPCCPSL